MLHCYIYTPVPLYIINTVYLAGLLIYLARFGQRSNTIGWFRVFLFVSIVYNIGSIPLHCPPNQAVFSLMVDLYVLMGGVTIPILFILIANFINKGHLLNRFWVRLTLFTTFIAYIYISWHESLAVYHDLAHTTTVFGYTALVLGPLSGVLGLFNLVGFLVPIAMCINYYRHVEDPLKKREVRLVTAALTITIVPSIVLEGFVQAVFHINVPPVGPIASIFAYSLITYALTKYGLRVLSLTDITADLTRVMPGGLTGTAAKHLFYTKTDYTTFRDAFKTNVDSGSNQLAGQETRLKTSAGEPLSISVNLVNVYAGAELTNRLISFTDITPLKHAQAALEQEKSNVERKVVERTHELAAAQAKLSASITSLPLGYIMIDSEYHVTTINPTARHILKITPTEPSVDLLSKKLGDYKLHDLVRRCLVKHHTIEVKELPVDKRYLHIYMAPIMDGTVVLGAVMLLEDITEQKILERSKDEFFSIASHELRTPLTSIRGNTSMMIEYYKQALKDPELQTMVHDVHESSIRLIGVVNDFLDVSRLEQGKVSFKFVEAHVVTEVESVAKELELEAANKHAHIRVSPTLKNLPTVIADTDRLKQVIFNLLGNALKFTENGSVHVTGEATADHVTVKVTDSGRGIPAASQNLLFHKFQQGGASLITRDTAKGTGLGLYISQLMIEGMGGRIWLDHSEEGKGSTFAFTLPISNPERLAAAIAKQNTVDQATDTITGQTTAAPHHSSH
jgi:two-component system phosphate regulon sensor histidine kinase PhoR